MPWDKIRNRYRKSVKGQETARNYHRDYYHRVLKFNTVNIEKRKQRNTENHYKRNYGLTLSQVHEMKSSGCAICYNKTGKMNIDHDHKTGRVRGVLCNPCNLMIGYIERAEKFGDSVPNYLKNKENKIAI